MLHASRTVNAPRSGMPVGNPPQPTTRKRPFPKLRSRFARTGDDDVEVRKAGHTTAGTYSASLSNQKAVLLDAASAIDGSNAPTRTLDDP